jgi:chitin disaccharide deacetylase
MARDRRLIVNADDFGRSSSINAAVIRAHREGIVTSASLMVNEPASAEAVSLAREHPSLGVGLHLTLLCGHSASDPETIPGLVNARREFPSNPVAAGFRYAFRRGLRASLRREIHAQFARFRDTGLPLDHVNGHLHLHLHPTVFRILAGDAEMLGVHHVRLTRGPFWLDVPLAAGRRGYRLLHAVLFLALAGLARPGFRRHGWRHTRRVFGLLENDRVHEGYLLKLLDALPAGDSELYSHPSLDAFRHEFEALISPRVKARIGQLGIRLIRYQDL